MIKISGRGTFDQREKIKDLGARWNGLERMWTLPDETAPWKIAELRKLPGVHVVEPFTPPQPMPEPKPLHIGVDMGTPPQPKRETDIDEIIRKIFEGINDPVDQPLEPGAVAMHGNDTTYFGQFARKPSAFFGFSRLADMVDFVERTPPAFKTERGDRSAGWAGGSGWAGSDSMEAAIDLARHGWPEGVEKAKEAAEVIQGDHAQARKRKHSLAGGRVNVGRMLSGSPVHMVHRPRQDGVKVISLFVDVWMNAGISADNAIIRAASVGAMCDVLENSGYSCEIVAAGSAQAGGARMQIATVIKQAGEALNVEDVVFSLGHPSMLRRLCFGLAANEQGLSRFWSSMGFQEAAFTNDNPGCFYINKLHRNPRKSDTFSGTVREIFKAIVPPGFPLDLAGEYDE